MSHRRHGDYRGDGRDTGDARAYGTGGYGGAPPNSYGGAQTGYAPTPSAYDTSRPTGGSSGPNWRWWIPAEGISRDVIQADIQRYLGNEALVRPGYGTGDNDGVPGYYIAAYRNLTASMIQDLKADSANWTLQQSQRGGRYEDSQTHQSRQYWGPTGSTPGQAPAQPAAPSYQQNQASYYQEPTGRREEYSGQPAGYAAPTTDYRRPAATGSSASSSDNPYYVATPGSNTSYSGSNTAYSTGSGSYEQTYGDQRVPRTSNVDTRRTGGTADYTGTSYQTPTYASPPTQQRQARPGYYIASDGREYPLSSMPTPGQR